MKNIVKVIVEKYGIDMIYYGFIIFDDDVIIKFLFSSCISFLGGFKNFIDFLLVKVGGFVLDKVLEVVVVIFEG